MMGWILAFLVESLKSTRVQVEQTSVYVRV